MGNMAVWRSILGWLRVGKLFFRIIGIQLFAVLLNNFVCIFGRKVVSLQFQKNSYLT